MTRMPNVNTVAFKKKKNLCSMKPTKPERILTSAASNNVVNQKKKNIHT